MNRTARLQVDVDQHLAERLRLVVDVLGGAGLDLATICAALLAEAAADLEARAEQRTAQET